MGDDPPSPPRQDRQAALALRAGGPVVHELPQTLEEVRPRIHGFDHVLNHVVQHRLDDLAQVVRLLAAQSRNERLEVMEYCRDPTVIEHLELRQCQYRPPAPHREHERMAVAERPSRVEDLHRPPAQRDAMLALRLHPQRRQGPDAADRVDLGPLLVTYFARPRGRQHREIESQLDGALPGSG